MEIHTFLFFYNTTIQNKSNNTKENKAIDNTKNELIKPNTLNKTPRLQMTIPFQTLQSRNKVKIETNCHLDVKTKTPKCKSNGTCNKLNVAVHHNGSQLTKRSTVKSKTGQQYNKTTLHSRKSVSATEEESKQLEIDLGCIVSLKNVKNCKF